MGTGAPQYLDVPNPTTQPGFWDVVGRRRSRRVFRELANTRLGALLWYTFKTSSKEKHNDGRTWEQRPVPSAGGLHPVHVIVQPTEGKQFPLLHYDPLGHALCDLNVDVGRCRDLRHHVESVLDPQEGTVLWLIGDFKKMHAYYENAASLLWRDSGVVIGFLCLVADALELNSCALGICGDSWLRTAMELPDGVYGVGAVVVGGRPQ